MSFDPEKITFFAKADARGKAMPFGIKAKDRQRHMYVIGKTGMGKSTLLENMAIQDIQNGEGMAFIDPHGSAAETLLQYVPEHRVNDVVYFAPFDLDNPVSFNVMEDVGPDKRHLVVSGLMSTFKKIWVDAWSARMEYILTNALLALIEYPDTTLLSVNRLFSDKHYRNRVVDYVKDPAVKAFWTEEFAAYTDRFAAEALPAIQNKIGQFTGNPLIRNIIGQPHSSFDIRKMMDEKKILIMNLSKGLVGETNANLLGSMLTTRIYLAAMSRADLPVVEMKAMPNFYFYVDEFQSFANATFANILSEARKYHLNLIIAHQYIEQMEEDVRNAVFGNVGTTVAFRVGPFDAEVLETIFTPRFLAADIVNLGAYQIYLTLMIDGIGSQPFSAVTLPAITAPRVSCRDMVVAASRKNYAKPRLEIENLITEMHLPVEAPPKPPKPDGQSTNTPKKFDNPEPKRDFGAKVTSEKKFIPREVTTQKSSTPDLRSREPVSGASTNQSPKSTNSEPVPRTTTEPPRRDTRPAQSDNRSAQRTTPPKTESVPVSPNKSAVPAPSTDSLRTILAKIAAENQKSAGKTSEPTVSTNAKPAPDPSPTKSALQSVLGTVLATKEVTTETVTAPVREPLIFTPQSVQSAISQPQPAVARTVSPSAPIQTVPVAGAVPVSPLPEPVPEASAIDPKAVKRILSDSGRERSPFR